MRRRLSLGLDLSTQSISAVVLDIDLREIVAAYSINYLKDPRLSGFGIREPDYILPPRIDGEADQPPVLFMAALDALFGDMSRDLPMGDIVVVNGSGQQHGHVYLNAAAGAMFAGLGDGGTETSDLVTLLGEAFAYDRAPIWMTSCTGREAAFIREKVGGNEELIQRTGSDTQLRFSGIVLRNVVSRFPDIYRRTSTIQLISSLVPAVLTGNSRVPMDYGNGSGMALMSYASRTWDDVCLRAVADGLPGGAAELRSKLPDIVAPDAAVGTACGYFVRKYGVSPECLVAAGSGDNPQSKVLVGGDLLSLGTSFVNMVATDGGTFDMTGAASAMYDGIGRPFMFGCRTNGALVWDQVRSRYGLQKEDYDTAEKALLDTEPGRNLVLWQPRAESFPASGSFDLWREEGLSAGLGTDYAGCIESSLAAVYLHSRSFAPATDEPLYVTGGAATSPGIMRRIAAIWDRPVITLEKMGAALGAAVAGVSALHKAAANRFDVADFTSSLISKGEKVKPLPEDITAFHGLVDFLERFATAEAKLIADHPA